MQEVINCPSCQRKLQVPETLLGQDVQCPSCSATFVASIGNQSQAPPPLPLAAPPRSLEPPPSWNPEPPAWNAGSPAPGPTAYPLQKYDDYDDYDNRGDRRDYPGTRQRGYRTRRDLAPHRGSLILTLGILSLVLTFLFAIGVILGPFAWIMGHQDMAEIRAGRMDPEGESSTSAGKICGMISSIIGMVALGSCLFCYLPAALLNR